MRGRWKKEILLFVIGAVWGFIYWGNTVWNPDVQYLLQDIKHIKLPLNWHWIFDSGVHLGIAALVLAVGTLLILWILRFLSDSRNTHGLIIAGQWFTDLILCSFLTGVILFYFNIFIQGNALPHNRQHSMAPNHTTLVFCIHLSFISIFFIFTSLSCLLYHRLTTLYTIITASLYSLHSQQAATWSQALHHPVLHSHHLHNISTRLSSFSL